MKDGRTLFWIADATGHGASAALADDFGQTAFSSRDGREQTAPAEIMEAVNNDFRSIFGARSFMTAMCVALDPNTGRASVVGAGHPPLLVARHMAERRESIRPRPPPLGLLERPSLSKRSSISTAATHLFFIPTDLFGAARNRRDALTPDAAGRNARCLWRTTRRPCSRALLDHAPRTNQGQTTLPDDVAAVAVRRRMT